LPGSIRAEIERPCSQASNAYFAAALEALDAERVSLDGRETRERHRGATSTMKTFALRTGKFRPDDVELRRCSPTDRLVDRQLPDWLENNS